MRCYCANRSWKSLFFVFFAFIIVNANAQPHADFNADIKQGCSPLIVSFTDFSTGAPTQWDWDLGNGITSTVQNAQTIYINPGTYTVKLHIKNASGEDSVTKTDYITVFENPVVTFTASQNSGCTPLDVYFTDSSTSTTTGVTKWIWDFGDGVTSTQQNPLHTYTISDSFAVSLTVFNSYGCRQTLQIPSFIKILQSPKSAFTYTYDNICKAPATVTFNNISESNRQLAYEWSFGDGTTSSQVSPQHTYNTPGSFTVTLTAISANGCIDISKQVISVGAAKADFSYSDACLNSPIVFTDKSTPNALHQSWDFGDGTTDSGEEVTHIYQTEGTFQVTLLSDFGECTDVIRKTITISKKPDAEFSAQGKTQSCTYPVTIRFNNNSQGAKSYKWIFSDSVVTDEENPVRTFNRLGKYTVALIAFNENGCSDTLIKDDFVEIGPPEIQGVEDLPFEGCAPKSFTFRPIIDIGQTVNKYLWDFGDGATSTDSTPTHVYQATGVYTVSLIVSTPEGCADTLSMPGAVRLGKPPKAVFSADPLNVCAKTPVQFTDASEGFITNRIWDFGDGGSSTETNPLYYYEDTGHFTVQLIVQQYGCSDTLVKDDYVFVKPPIAAFNVFSKCSDPFTVAFIDGSIGAKRWIWNFGDGETFQTIIPKQSSPTHVYKTTGIFGVSLTVTNGECSYRFLDSIHVIKEDPSFEYQFLSPNSCEHDSIFFSATNYTPGNVQSFQWDFGDGAGGYGDTVYHVYAESGTFFPTLIVKDINSCVDTISNNTKVKVLGPTAAFTNKSGDCLGSNFNFKDESLTDKINPIKTWIWNYGDGSPPDTLSSPPYKHRYDSLGTFTVLLKVIDANNCYDTTSNLPLSITSPSANFFTTDTLSCTGSAVEFFDSSDAESPTYNWYFGDGDSAEGISPQHYYKTDGAYSVKMVLTDKYGCSDSVLKPNYVRIANPVANYKLDDTLFLCPPGKIDPLINSFNYTNAMWDFGDGNTSSQIAPEHYYTQAGVYNVKLTVTGYGNCTDTFSKPITLRGPFATFSDTPFTGCNPLTVSFTAQAKNTVKYIWDFGNGVVLDSTLTSVNYTYLKPGKFLPQLVIVDSGGCTVPVLNSDTLIAKGAAALFNATQQQGLCDSSLFYFTDSSQIFYDSVTSYHWYFGDGDSLLAINPQHYYAKAGLVTTALKITTAGGCESNYEFPINVTIDSTPVISLIAPDTSCVNESFTVNAGILNNTPANFTWTLDFGDSSFANVPDTNHAYQNAGNYILNVSATSAAGCSDTAMHSIYINPLPVIDAGADSIICKGKSITLTVSGGITYNWLPDASLSCQTCATPLASPLYSNTYYVTGANKYNCIASDSVFVEVKQPANISLTAPDTVCVGTTIQLAATGAEIYTWQPASQVNNPTDSVTLSTPSSTLTYYVIGTDSKNCFRDTASAFVRVYPVPAIHIKDSIIQIQGGDSYQVNIQGSEDITNWLWSPASNTSCSDCANPVITPDETKTYTVTAKNAGGCSAEKHIVFNVWCKDQNVFIPNTFSPNGDGMNDYFYPRGKGLSNIKSFRIFNRWGIIVYERSNFPPNQQSFGWDGKYKGNALQPDVYVFIAEVMCENNQVISLKGNVTLLR